MNELALFCGAGGGILGSRLLEWRTVCGVEIDPYCREVLLRRQEEGHIEPFPIWDDIRTFDGKSWRKTVDIVSAGFPCQPFSVAGKRKGENDSRNMWPETARVIAEVRPGQVLLENVPGIRKYLPVVIRDLRRTGYAVKRPKIVAAASVGAGHIRKRVWVFAYLDKARQQDNPGGSATKAKPNQRDAACVCGRQEISTNSNEGQRDGEKEEVRARRDTAYDGGWWKAEPNVVRVVHGCPYGVDRIKALGNAQVPAVVRRAWELLTGD